MRAQRAGRQPVAFEGGDFDGDQAVEIGEAALAGFDRRGVPTHSAFHGNVHVSVSVRSDARRKARKFAVCPASTCTSIVARMPSVTTFGTTDDRNMRP